jgi:hypothetical protein
MGNSSFHPERSKLPPGGTFGLSDPADPELDPDADPDPDPVLEPDVVPDDPDDPEVPDEPAPDPELDPLPLPVDAPDDDAPLDDETPLDDDAPLDAAPPDDPPATCQGAVAVSPQAAHTHKAAAATREARGAEGVRPSFQDILKRASIPRDPGILAEQQPCRRFMGSVARAHAHKCSPIAGYGTSLFVSR